MTYEWLPAALSFIDEYGVPREVVEAAAANPTTTGLNAESGRDGYVIEDRRRGDITAVVGLREDAPSILYVRVHTPDDDFSRGSSGTPGSGQSTTPKTWRGVRARILFEGFVISAGGSHDRVETRDGEFLCSLPTTPGAYTGPANGWSSYQRARDCWRARRRVAQGDLLRSAS